MHSIDDVSKLSNKELSQAMKELDINIGITSSTRKICENRYKLHLIAKFENEKNENEDNFETMSGPPDPVFGDGDNNRSNQVKLSDAKGNHKVEAELLSNDSECNGDNNNISQHDIVESNKISEQDNVENNDSKEIKDLLYYGVSFPFSPQQQQEEIPLVFMSQTDALKAMKNVRGSRFKSFSSKEEAELFSVSKPQPLSVEKICAMVASSQENSQPIKPLIKQPTTQELFRFRKQIEDNQIQSVQKHMLSNPKYIISSSDMPVILQIGSRLNAIHICIKYNRLNILEFILHTLQEHSFLKLMYPSADFQSLEFRKTHLMDLYLNTPEKILCDSPLHIACKYGLVDVIRYLIEYSQLNVKALNKDRKSCKQVVCQRVNVSGEAKQVLKKKIQLLLEDKAYIPLFDLEVECKVGEPVISLSPKALKSTNKKIKAFAGPMTIEKAPIVYKRWSKSPKYRSMMLSDFDKGLERVGRVISYQERVPFSEYWSFLNCYTNLSTKTGLMKLENYLKIKTEKQLLKKLQCKRLSSSVPKSSFIRNDKKDLEIKRKLSFDNAKEGDNNCDEVTNNINDKTTCTNHDKSTSLHVEECYCVCGELLQYCDKCGTVSINFKTLSVAFSLTSPIKDEHKGSNDLEKIDDELEMLTLKSSPHVTDMEESVFIYGEHPSKQDVDVLRAIGGELICEPLLFPHIQKWKECVDSYSKNEINNWPTPGSPRHKQRNLMWTN